MKTPWLLAILLAAGCASPPPPSTATTTEAPALDAELSALQAELARPHRAPVLEIPEPPPLTGREVIAKLTAAGLLPRLNRSLDPRAELREELMPLAPEGDPPAFEAVDVADLLQPLEPVVLLEVLRTLVPARGWGCNRFYGVDEHHTLVACLDAGARARLERALEALRVVLLPE